MEWKLARRFLLVLPTSLSPTASKRQEWEPHPSLGHGVDSILPSSLAKNDEITTQFISHDTLDNGGFKIPHSLKTDLQD